MIRLPRLQIAMPLVDGQGRPSSQYQRFFQTFAEAIETQENNQDTTINRIRRLLSHTNPTTIVTTSDDGTTATATIANHTRVYADATSLNITGGAIHGLTSNTAYALYYDDTTLMDPSPTFKATTDVALAQSASADGRHFLGIVFTPVAGSGATRSGGGVYPAGSSVGGELQ